MSAIFHAIEGEDKGLMVFIYYHAEFSVLVLFGCTHIVPFILVKI